MKKGVSSTPSPVAEPVPCRSASRRYKRSNDSHSIVQGISLLKKHEHWSFQRSTGPVVSTVGRVQLQTSPDSEGWRKRL
jgi:hypothetical protein